MKTTLICSIVLNVLLLAFGAVIFFGAGEQTAKNLPAAHTVAVRLPPEATTKIESPAPTVAVAEPFRWKQLDSGNDYRLFIANLRAAGCPENTIADIVIGNVGRAFAWQRAQLKIDGSGNGPWSRTGEIALVDDLLGKSNGAYVTVSSQNLDGRLSLAHSHQTAIGQSAGAGQVAQLSSSQEYPQYSQATSTSSTWLAQGGTWNGNMGPPGAVSANQSSSGQSPADANSQPGQNSGIGPQLNSSPNDTPNSSDPNSAPAGPAPQYFSPNGVPASDDPYAKSSQDLMAEQQAQYVEWFARQAAQSDGINPASAPQ